MKEKILTAIQLSKLAYDPLPKIMAKLNIAGYTDVKAFNGLESDVQGFFCTDKVKAWVVIRGTEIDSLRDWKRNFNAGFHQSHWGEVHKGFYFGAIVGINYILPELNKAIEEGKEIIFTGHSQGAAIALQMFACNEYKRNKLCKCIPVEAPRSFSKAAAKKFGAWWGRHIYPVINNNDIVTNVPTRFMGYAHVERTYVQYIDRKGNVRQGITWKNKFFDRLLGMLSHLGKPGLDVLEDHNIGTIERVWKEQM